MFSRCGTCFAACASKNTAALDDRIERGFSVAAARTMSGSTGDHAIFHPPDDSSLVGTDVVLRGVSDGDIADAKNFFLQIVCFAPLYRGPWFADKACIAVPRSVSETLSTAKGLLT